MRVNTTWWNRARYGAVAPLYDALTAPLQAVGFAAARRRAMELLAPRPGARLLLVGVGTGQDLDNVPPGVQVIATDLSPAMVARAERRAERLGLEAACRVMDGEALELDDGSVDHVALHLVLAVMPDPYACAREVGRVLAPGGTVSVFDKFVPDGKDPSLLRRLLNPLATTAFTDLTRRLGPILDAGGLHVVHREPAVLGLFDVALVERVAALPRRTDVPS